MDDRYGFIDITDQVFGRWTVLSRASNRGTSAAWNCRCVCGVVRVVIGGRLRSGGTSSCGSCVKVTHGGSRSPEYHCWMSLIKRCTNPDHHSYPNYGGRGIRVCQDWVGPEGYLRFVAHIGKRPGYDYSVDRIDNNGHYEPGNVRWATQKEQHRNKRSNRLLTFRGRTMCLAEWAEETGIGRRVIAGRVANGWPVERTLTERVRKWDRHN